MNVRLVLVQLHIGILLAAAGCGGGGVTSPSAFSPAPSPAPVAVTEVSTNLPPLTPLEGSIKEAYAQAFHENVFRPAVFNVPGCSAAHVTSTAYLGSSGKSSTLLTLYTSSDGGSVTKKDSDPTLTPAGTLQVLVTVVRYPQTIGDDTIGLLEIAQRQINEDYASFARARGYASPIVALNNTNVVIDASQVGDPRQFQALATALSQQGVSVNGYDVVVAINIDPARLEGGFANTGTVNGTGPRFVYMGNFGDWKTRLSGRDLTSISGSVYHHEVVHLWGWPATHDWASCGDHGFNFRVPPVLLGWEDVDGDGVPEILDETPYARSRR